MEKLNEKLLNQRKVFISGDFTEKSIENVIKQLIYLDSCESITLYVDSYGGSTYAFLKIYNVIKGLKSKVNIIATGKVMSAGALLLMIGNHRSAYKYTQIMIHEISYSLAYDKMHVNDIDIKHNKYIQKILDKIITEHTKLKGDFKEDTYFTAQEALQYGIIDEIID